MTTEKMSLPNEGVSQFLISEVLTRLIEENNAVKPQGAEILH